MIQLYTGVPGAGKTYKMVHDFNLLIKDKPGITVIANIRDLKLPHINFDDYLQEQYPDNSLKQTEKIERFFSYENQKKTSEKFGGPILYILDECQLYFPRRSGLPETEAYFQRHRHLGHYIYLATQSVKLINSNLVALIEVEYYAVRRSVSFFGEMHYRIKSPQTNTVMKTMFLRPKKAIFNLYKSFEANEIVRPKRELLKKLWPLALLPFAAFFFYDRVLNPDKKLARMTGKAPEQIQTAENVLQENKNSPGYDALLQDLENLHNEVKKFETQLEQKERVFLPVVQSGKRKLTVDPETGAVVEVSQIKGRKVICVNQGLSCYYDKSVITKIRIPSYLPGSSLPPLSYFPFTMKSGASTPAKKDDYSFITADMVPRN